MIIVEVLDKVLIPRITRYRFDSKEEAIKAIREYDEDYYLPDEKIQSVDFYTHDWHEWDFTETDIYLDDEVVSAYDYEGKCNDWDENILGERHDNS